MMLSSPRMITEFARLAFNSRRLAPIFDSLKEVIETIWKRLGKIILLRKHLADCAPDDAIAGVDLSP
jgi:hypothetical protein